MLAYSKVPYLIPGAGVLSLGFNQENNLSKITGSVL